MSSKPNLENKLSMLVYDNVKFQKKIKGLVKSVKEVEKTLNNVSKK